MHRVAVCQPWAAFDVASLCTLCAVCTIQDVTLTLESTTQPDRCWHQDVVCLLPPPLIAQSIACKICESSMEVKVIVAKYLWLEI